MWRICGGTLLAALPIVFAAVWLPGSATALVQRCNPAIDGTYCETEMRRSSTAARPGISMQPVQSIGSDVLQNQDRPATFGGITFQGSGKCIGLLRRGACN
jgi:hypothetical protein